MKLYEYKAKYLNALALYQTKSQREKELVDLLVVKLNALRNMTLPNLLFTLYQIIQHEENVTEELKEICRKMILDSSSIESEA